jgi:hypothetical protein
MIVSLRTDVLPPSLLVQNAWLSTVTKCVPGVRSSLSSNSRPISGRTPRIGKYDPETCMPSPEIVWPR